MSRSLCRWRLTEADHRPFSTGQYPPRLAARHVHVWCTHLDLRKSTVNALQKTLSCDELERAMRLRAVEDRDRFIAARGQLRVILASYLSVPPERLRFTYGRHGKPALHRGFEGNLRFNLSHAGAAVLYAIARGRELGVDLERVHAHSMDEHLAGEWFSPEENEALRKLPLPARHEAFSRCWTRREAYGKARGNGLLFSYTRREVSPIITDSMAGVEGEADSPQTGAWSLRELDVGPGYVSALVVEGQGWRLVRGRFAVSVVNAPGRIAAPETASELSFSFRLSGRDQDEELDVRTPP
jgi:4'-phosphopantetheinyl transferase